MHEADDVLDLFAPAPGITYLDSATYGLPPRTTIEALREAEAAWQGGTAHWIEDWDREAETCRALAARMMGAQTREVSLMPAVSVASAIVASSVPEGGEVLLVENDFTSVLFPFFEAERRGRLKTRAVALSDLAHAVRPETALVAVSHVQSSNGAVADLAALRDATTAVGARLYVDASQGLGSLPIDVGALGIDFLACGAYKWLCCPRGVAFLYVAPARWDETSAVAASWRAGDDPYGRFYGAPLALAPDAARFDVSLAWHPWVGARHALEALARLDDTTRFDLGHRVVVRLAERLDLPEPGANILSVPVHDAEAAGRELAQAGIRISKRVGQLRVSCHLYNTLDDAERAADAIRPWRSGGNQAAA